MNVIRTIRETCIATLATLQDASPARAAVRTLLVTITRTGCSDRAFVARFAAALARLQFALPALYTTLQDILSAASAAAAVAAEREFTLQLERDRAFFQYRGRAAKRHGRTRTPHAVRHATLKAEFYGADESARLQTAAAVRSAARKAKASEEKRDASSAAAAAVPAGWETVGAA